MLFCSYIFLLFFLPVTLIGYYFLLKHSVTAARIFLLISSLFFYGYFNWNYLWILLFSLTVNFILGKILFSRKSKAVLLAGLFINILLLGYFKYCDFFIENTNILFRTSFVLQHILLPLGISFYTFQQIGYLLDIFNGKLTERYSFLTYALFITFFPQLIAGPIVLAGEMMPQFDDPEKQKLIPENMAAGIFIFSLGLGKKMLLADHFAVLADLLFSHETPGCILSATGTLAYMFQIYFDFSGYSDMAIGLGLMFNILLPANFLSPYRSGNIQEFWRTWHITLGRFLSQFIYHPLGGSRKGTVLTCRNLMITFLISGFWHGAGWNFILWGALHGFAMICHRIWNKSLGLSMPRICGIFLTFLFTAFSWIFFRASDLRQAGLIFAGFFSFSSEAIPELEEFLWFGAAFVIIFFLPPAYSFCKRFRPNIITWLTALALLVISFFHLTRYSPFIYFNF